jgi:hypothetical protein
MQNPIRTLLYGLLVEPIIRVLQAISDSFVRVTSLVTRNRRQSNTRAAGTKVSSNLTARDTRTHWEKMGIVVPVYRLIIMGANDHDIAMQLNLTENTVYGCTGYLMRRLKCRTRAELVLYASPKPDETWSLRSAPTMLVSGLRRWQQRRLANSL